MDVLSTFYYERPQYLKSSSTIFSESLRSAERKLHLRPIQVLDEFAAQLSAPSTKSLNFTSIHDMQLAGQLTALSSAYREYCLLNVDVGNRIFRSQELQERAYDFLRKRLGKWHHHTVKALNTLTSWDITVDQRQKYVAEAIDRIKTQQPLPFVDSQMMFNLVKCCLRNEDYGDGKALRTLLQDGHVGDVDTHRTLANEWRIALHYVQIRQKDWDAADQLPWEPPANTATFSERWLPEDSATLDDLQTSLATLDRDEAVLIKGAVAENSWNLDDRPCAELLIEMYLERGKKGLHKAEKWLRLMVTDESRRSKSYGIDGPFNFFMGQELASNLVEVRNWEPSDHDNFLERDWALCSLRLNKYKYQLANVHVRQKRYAEARLLLEEVIGANLHRENPIRASSKELLVTVYLKLKRPKKAEQMQETIVEETKEKFGEDSKELLPALGRLSKIYRMNGQWPKKNEVDLCILRYRE